MAIYLDDEAIIARLGTRDAFDCVRNSFILLANGLAVNAVRRRSQSGSIVLNVMWAIAPTEGVMGVKSYPTVKAGGTQGSVLMLLVYSTETGELLAIMEADRLGQIRTGAATAVATSALARVDSEILSLFGTGLQAEAQLRSLVEVMPHLKTVNVVGRNPDHRDAFIARMQEEFEIDLNVVEPEDATRTADVIVTATASADPVFHGSWVRPGTHINSVGSNAPGKREVDRGLLEKSTLILVDDQDVAELECGDLLVNEWDFTNVGTLGDVLTGRIGGRESEDDITLFESQGIALQDVVCAAFVLAHARELGVGKSIV